MLSNELKERIRVAITDKETADELISAIELGVAPQADNVPVLGSTTNLPASNVTLSTTDTYTDAAVKAAIDAAVDALRTAVESRLDAAEGKIDAVIGSLVDSEIMDS